MVGTPPLLELFQEVDPTVIRPRSILFLVKLSIPKILVLLISPMVNHSMMMLPHSKISEVSASHAPTVAVVDVRKDGSTERRNASKPVTRPVKSPKLLKDSPSVFAQRVPSETKLP